MNGESNSRELKEFTKKVWITTGIVALAVVILMILKTTFNVLLLLLAGALIALYFRGLSHLLQTKFKMPSKAALPVSIICSILLLILFFWFAGNSIQQQANQLAETLPAAVDSFEQKLSESNIGRKVLERVKSPETSQKASALVQSFFRGTFGVLGDIYIILFLGIFFTASPKLYVNGALKLVPLKSRPQARHVVDKVGAHLTKWLKGQLLAMLIVSVLTVIGLLIMGIPMAFVLAIIAGLLNFIPNFGPLIAMVPAVLISLMQSPTTALLVAGLYILVQTLESNLITPQIQKRMINTPPALIIIAQLFMGVLSGVLGLLLAMPIVVILIVVVQELYVKKQEGS
ncbi:MAG: AI-2E family transporter [Chitinophagaceae bacterium]